MNAPDSASDIVPPGSPQVFVSYASADRAQALSVCKAIESRGPTCWIATRDVAPGENYQEAIVHAIRSAQAVVLVFSDAANHSDEIKKELSLASRFHVPVMAVRIEDVEPSDAFAYELSTRQWIDAFEGWDKAIDSVVSRIGQLRAGGQEGKAATPATAATPFLRRAVFTSGRSRAIAAAAGLLALAVAGGAW
ncbi:MAG: toll/interleukin-1 receptor domain-containing protein, partial [Pseudoxanthomonas sp.]